MRALLVPFREDVKQNAARLDDGPNRRHIDQEPIIGRTAWPALMRRLWAGRQVSRAHSRHVCC